MLQETEGMCEYAIYVLGECVPLTDHNITVHCIMV